MGQKKMRNKISMITTSVVIVFSSLQAFAQSNTMSMELHRPPPYQSDSERNRDHKTLTANVELFGLGPGNLEGAGGSVGFFLNRNQMLIAEAKAGKMSLVRTRTVYINGSKTEEYKSSTTGSIAGLAFKHFFGSSFYMKPAADVTRMSYSFSPLSSAYGSGYMSEFEATTVGASLSIGNQWQWENFTLGCDWLGYRQVVTKNFSKDRISGNFDDWDLEQFKRDKDMFTQSNLLALRFYLGASF